MQDNKIVNDIDSKPPIQWLNDEYHNGSKLDDVKEKIRTRFKNDQFTMRVALSAADNAYAVWTRGQ